MANNNELGHISYQEELSSLIDKVRAGSKEAWGRLSVLICQELQRAGAEAQDVEDLAQEAMFRLSRAREKGGQIKNPLAFIRKVTRNVFLGDLEKTKAKKRAGGPIESLDGRQRRADEEDKRDPAEGERILGAEPAGPDELAELREDRGAAAIKASYMELPADLRAGIEQSLGLMTDLFMTRDRIRKDRIRSRPILKAVKTIKAARKSISRTGLPTPRDKDLWRLYEFREMTPNPGFYGIPEKDKEVRARLDEERDLVTKYGAVYHLWEAERELERKLLMDYGPLINDLVPGPMPWSRHLSVSDIGWMKISPAAVIYKVWSRAPGFSKGKLGKYRNRVTVGDAIRYHKLVSKGTPREFLFASVPDIRNIDDRGKAAKALERFRKAGYGAPLQKKYRRIIELITRLSFGVPRVSLERNAH